MGRRLPDTSVAAINVAFLCALLSVRGTRAFAFLTKGHRVSWGKQWSTSAVSSSRCICRTLEPRKNTKSNSSCSQRRGSRSTSDFPFFVAATASAVRGGSYLSLLQRSRQRHQLYKALAMSFSSLPTSTATATKRHHNSFLVSHKDPGAHVARGDVDENSAKNAGDRDTLVLVVLNTKGDGESRALFRHLWAGAKLRICADGGANRLHDGFEDDSETQETAEDQRARYIPDVIVGDLDSLRPDVAAYYRERGTEVKVHEDQDHNDFEKCLLEVERRLGRVESTGNAAYQYDAGPQIGDVEEREQVNKAPERGGAMAPEEKAAAATSVFCAASVVGLGAFGGRFDHEMAGISLLHAYTHRFAQLVLMGAGNVAFLLAPGVQHIIEPDARFEGPTVGLIPIGGACRSVTTEGLKWNLHNGVLEFGVLVSSSNCVEGKEVRITTDAPLVWTAEFRADEWAKVVISGDCIGDR